MAGVAERELTLPRSLTKRLVKHARPGDVTEGYAKDWTVQQQPREPARRIADRIDEVKEPYMLPAEPHPPTERGFGTRPQARWTSKKEIPGYHT